MERLIEFIREDLEIEDWARILTGFEISLSSIGDYKEYIDNKTREGLSEYIAKAILEKWFGFRSTCKKSIKRLKY